MPGPAARRRTLFAALVANAGCYTYAFVLGECGGGALAWMPTVCASAFAVHVVLRRVAAALGEDEHDTGQDKTGEAVPRRHAVAAHVSGATRHLFHPTVLTLFIVVRASAPSPEALCATPAAVHGVAAVITALAIVLAAIDNAAWWRAACACKGKEDDDAAPRCTADVLRAA